MLSTTLNYILNFWTVYSAYHIMAGVLTSFLFPILFLSECRKFVPTHTAMEYFIVIASFEATDEDLPLIVSTLSNSFLNSIDNKKVYYIECTSGHPPGLVTALVTGARGT